METMTVVLLISLMLGGAWVAHVMRRRRKDRRTDKSHEAAVEAVTLPPDATEPDAVQQAGDRVVRRMSDLMTRFRPFPSIPTIRNGHMKFRDGDLVFIVSTSNGGVHGHSLPGTILKTNNGKRKAKVRIIGHNKPIFVPYDELKHRAA